MLLGPQKCFVFLHGPLAGSGSWCVAPAAPSIVTPLARQWLATKTKIIATQAKKHLTFKENTKFKHEFRTNTIAGPISMPGSWHNKLQNVCIEPFFYLEMDCIEYTTKIKIHIIASQLYLFSLPFCVFQDWTLHPRHGVWGHCEEAGHAAEGALRQVCGHGYPGTD